MLFRLCRFVADDLPIRIGLLTDHETVLDLTDAGVDRMHAFLERNDLTRELMRLNNLNLKERPLDRLRLKTPVESQEVWAAPASSRRILSRFKKVTLSELVFQVSVSSKTLFESCDYRERNA